MIGRPKIPNYKKRKKIAFTIDPIVYKSWIEYCEDNNILNKSIFIEKMIEKMIENSIKTNIFLKIYKKIAK